MTSTLSIMGLRLYECTFSRASACASSSVRDFCMFTCAA